MGKPLLWQPHDPKTKLRRNPFRVCKDAVIAATSSAKEGRVKKARLKIGGRHINGYLLNNVILDNFFPPWKYSQVFFQPITESNGYAYYTEYNRKGEKVLVRKPVKSKLVAELTKFCKENAKQ
ncbi:MAG: hypothetical protein V1676_04460 [Candidatus Diapherotrites archaeon]